MKTTLPPPPVLYGKNGSAAAHFKGVPTARLVRELQKHWHQYRSEGINIRGKKKYALYDFLIALHERADRSTFRAACALIRSRKSLDRIQGYAILRELGYPRPKFRETWALLERTVRTETDPVALHWAVGCLGWTQNKRAFPTLLRFVNHPHPWVRGILANNLLGCAPSVHDPAAVDAILILCDDKDARVRWDAVYEAKEYFRRTPRIREMFARHAKDRDRHVRILAKKALKCGPDTYFK